MDTIVWNPIQPEMSQMSHFMSFIETKFNRNFQQDYERLQLWSIEHPAEFWQSLCGFMNVEFDQPPETIFQPAEQMINARWFEGATFNFAEKLLQADGEQLAIIEVNEVGQRQSYNFNELRQQVANCAAGLRSAGIKAGDRVAGVLPNCSTTIIAMLATTSIGAVWSSCSPDFGTSAIIDRLGQIQPKVLFISNGHQYQGKTFSAEEKIQALAESIPELEKIVLVPFLTAQPAIQRPAQCIHWDEFLIKESKLNFTPQAFNHPLYIMFSSGRTSTSEELTKVKYNLPNRS